VSCCTFDGRGELQYDWNPCVLDGLNNSSILLNENCINDVFMNLM
jgi:hypothetical protein